MCIICPENILLGCVRGFAGIVVELSISPATEIGIRFS